MTLPHSQEEMFKKKSDLNGFVRTIVAAFYFKMVTAMLYPVPTKQNKLVLCDIELALTIMCYTVKFL